MGGENSARFRLPPSFLYPQLAWIRTGLVNHKARAAQDLPLLLLGLCSSADLAYITSRRFIARAALHSAQTPRITSERPLARKFCLPTISRIAASTPSL